MKLASTLLLAALASGSALGAAAQPAAEVFPLGRSQLSGAVCEAVRNYDDDLNRFRGARVWNVRCQGWETQLGKLYLLPQEAAETSWRQQLAARASCAAPAAHEISGLKSGAQQICGFGASKQPYIVYTGASGKARLAAAEGFNDLADVLQAAVGVVAGAKAPPAPLAAQTSVASQEIAADFGGPLQGLAAAQAAALQDPTRLKTRGYVQNNEWRFSDAENDFRALVTEAESRNAPARERAEALLNLALNVSNSRRFAEADALFAQAEPYVATADDALLRARALNYRALHARNQQDFAKAVTLAQQALEARTSARTATRTAASPTAANAGGVVRITAQLASELNTRVGAQDVLGGQAIDPQSVLLVEDVQALEVIGSSRAAQDDYPGAKTALDDAWRRLSARDGVGALNVSLSARVQADLAGVALAQGNADEAVRLDQSALKILRTRHAGTSAEAGLLIELARAQQARGDADAALDSYGKAFALFRSQRGYVGASADLSQGYFDLLLARAAADPAHARDAVARFFDAAETVVSRATAETVNRLALRVATNDPTSSGLIRAMDDTQRALRMAESRIATLQISNAYGGDARAAADADLAAQQKKYEELQVSLLQANPRYLQLVSHAASMDDLQKALGPDEAYLKVLGLRDKTYVVVVTAGAANAYGVDLSRSKIDAAVKHLRAPMDSASGPPPFDVAASYDLYHTLFGPAEGQLAGVKHLIYEPDGALISLPVATFATAPADAATANQIRRGANYQGVAWLGAKLDSSLTLSAQSFLDSRKVAASKASRPLLAFGNPQLPRSGEQAYAEVVTRGGQRSATVESVCGLTRQALLNAPPLPETAQEVANIARTLNAGPQSVVTGAAFSDSEVRARQDLDQYRVVYFATHALLPQPDACLPEPALLTSLGGADSDAMLLTSQILQLKLDADLVVLSACNTGGAGATDSTETGLTGGGEALGGLARAMIYAGARGLVVSHWGVDSEATVKLMTDMFGSRAASQAQALQQAQRSMQQTARLSHPYYWAAFTIVGDGRRPMPGLQTAAPEQKAALEPAGAARF
jgi:CHAT domain-containing protein